MIRDVSTEREILQITVGSALDELYAGVNWELTYTDAEGSDVEFLDGDEAIELLEQYSTRKFLCPNKEHATEDAFYAAIQFQSRYKNAWNRRKAQLGWLDQMFKRTDYDPLENYDRHEDGGWKDTTDLGAKTKTANLTDSYATYTDTDTETPTVKTRTTETPTVKTKTTETPTVKTKTTETPTVKTKTTETPTVKTKTTETPGVAETETSTPRTTIRTTESPGVSITVAESFYGDNSSTMVPSKSTTTSPGANQSNVTTVEGVGGTDQKQTTRTGTNETVNEVVSGNTIVENEVISGNTQVTRVKGAHIDTHNTTYGEQAAQDVITRLYQSYRVHGNIGIRAVADMLGTELALRGSIDLPAMFIRDFIESVTFYAE